MFDYFESTQSRPTRPNSIKEKDLRPPFYPSHVSAVIYDRTPRIKTRSLSVNDAISFTLNPLSHAPRPPFGSPMGTSQMIQKYRAKSNEKKRVKLVKKQVKKDVPDKLTLLNNAILLFQDINSADYFNAVLNLAEYYIEKNDSLQALRNAVKAKDISLAIISQEFDLEAAKLIDKIDGSHRSYDQIVSEKLQSGVKLEVVANELISRILLI